MQYYKFSEYNDWEGETWNFFIPCESLDVAKRIMSIINEITGDTAYEQTYKLASTESFSETEVDTLVKHGDSGYMRQFNKASNTIDIMSLMNAKPDELYKGGILNFCKTEA